MELIPEVGVVYPLFAIKGYLFYTKYIIYLCIVFWYYPLFVAICEICLLKLTYGAYLVLSWKSGITPIGNNFARKALEHFAHVVDVFFVGIEPLLRSSH